MASARITFSCKDPQVLAYYQNKFGLSFTRRLATFSNPSLDTLERARDKFVERMLLEAARQQHYDYEYADGQRRLIFEANGVTPKLLVPELKIEIR